jgi:POT family proton-dependent oligopeptide transporter
VLPKGQYKLGVKDRDPLYLNIFWLALSLIIVGVGFMKANVATLVGQLYPQGDPRRDPGFTLYYYGINLGSFWAAILCGLLGVNGRLVGGLRHGRDRHAGRLRRLRAGQALAAGQGRAARAQAEGPGRGPDQPRGLIYAGRWAWSAVFFLVQYTPVVSVTLIAGMFGSLGYILWFAFVKCEKVERERLLLATVLVLGAVVFWTLFEQAGSSLNLFAATNVNLTCCRIRCEWFGGAVTAGRARAAGRRRHRHGRQAVGQHLLQRRPDPGHQRRLDPDLRPGLRRPLDGAGQARKEPQPDGQVRPVADPGRRGLPDPADRRPLRRRRLPHAADLPGR